MKMLLHAFLEPITITNSAHFEEADSLLIFYETNHLAFLVTVNFWFTVMATMATGFDIFYWKETIQF